MKSVAISKKEFFRLSSFVEANFGIHLGENKATMVEQRLRPLLLSGGFSNLDAFLDRVEGSHSGPFVTELLNRITTNHTFFNREPEHFRYLEQVVLPEHVRWVGSGARVLRMWCAASSKGHEPYQLAMIQRAVFGDKFGSWDAGLLATDISEQALSFALRATFPTEEFAVLPDRFRKHFTRDQRGDYEVSEEVRRDVTFRKFNLAADSYPFRRNFDVVFCRNVLIYFEPATKREVVRKIGLKLRAGGFLFVGLSESLGREVHGLESVAPGVYRKKTS